MEETFWRRCSTCKREIGFEQTYSVCSVSTCNRKASSYVFCCVSCWQEHVPLLRHRESWAEEQCSPSLASWRRGAGGAPPRDVSRPASVGISGDRLEGGSRVDPAQASAPAPASVGTTSAPSGAAGGTASGAARERGVDTGARESRRIIVTSGGETPERSVDRDIPIDVLIVASKLKKYIRARSGMSTSDGVMEELSDRVRSLCDDAVARAREAGRKTVMDRDV